MEKGYKKTLLLYNLTSILLGIILYFALPKMLNYPPNAINNEFEKTIDMGMNYYVQYIGIMLFAMIIANLSIMFELNKVKKWRKFINNVENNEEEIEELDKIKKVCFIAPLKLYFSQAFVPPIIVVLVMLFTGAEYLLVARISIIAFCIFLAMGLITYVSSKKIFTTILLNINNREMGNTKSRIRFRTKIFFQFLPLTILIGLMVYLVTNTIGVNDKSNMLSRDYSLLIKEQSIEDSIDLNEVISKLQNIKKKDAEDVLFIIKENDYSVVYKDIDSEISDFFIKYTFMEGKNGHTYGYYATDIEGTFNFITIDGEKYAVGIMYSTAIKNGYVSLILVILFMIIIIICFLLFFSHDISDQVNIITQRMKDLLKGESVDYNKKIPVTANDEIGELIMAFNKIQDLTKEYINEIHNNQETLMESDRLASLGQLIGGIAHNLKTPIMSISGNLQGLQDLILEYKTSIGDPEVTEDDNKDIAKDMQELVDKTRIHLSYMSDIITVVKGQAVQTNEKQIFSAVDVLQRIDILMKHNLKKALVELRTEIDEDAKTAYLKGDINGLVQVIDNCIQNAIQSYGEKTNQFIDLKITKQEESICFAIIDYGCGIPKEVQEKLFKEMITTKGKNGTGLGLYMSHSLIKGNFKGDFRFESEVGKGTTFYIIIPISQ